MALETATGIYDLNSANPTGTDQKAQGDDHIRLIKSTLLNTFANVTVFMPTLVSKACRARDS